MTDDAVWHKSSYSGQQGHCVEVAEGPVTGIRDTQNPGLSLLAIPSAEWTALLNVVRTTR